MSDDATRRRAARKKAVDVARMFRVPPHLIIAPRNRLQLLWWRWRYRGFDPDE